MAQTEIPSPTPTPDAVAAGPESSTPASPVPTSATPQSELSPVGPGICEAACAGLLVVLALAPNSLLNGDGDTAHHLGVGRVILAQQAIPAVDIFSHTHLGQPFLDWEWGAEVIFAVANAALGLNGVAILAAALIAGTLYLLCRWLIAQGLHPVLALPVGLLTAVASEIHWLARPHLFTFLLTLLVLVLLESYRQGRVPARRLAFVVPLMAVWANLHAGFVTGLILCVSYLGGAVLEWAAAWARSAGWALPYPPRAAASQPPPVIQMRSFGLALGAGAVATLITPYGLGLYSHIAGFLQSSFLTQIIVEYQPPNPRSPITWAFFLMLVLTVAVVAMCWRRIPPAHYALLAGWTYLSLQAARNVPLFSLLVPALLAPQLAYLVNRERRAVGRSRRSFWARYRLAGPLRQGTPWIFAGSLAGLVLLAALGGAGILSARWTTPPFPIAAVEWLQTTAQPPRGKMFNDMTWGGYLLYTLYPRQQIFIDGQQDVFGEALNRDYLTTQFAQPGWQDVLTRYDVGWVIEPPDSPLVQALQAQPAAWQQVYADPVAVILTRK